MAILAVILAYPLALFAGNPSHFAANENDHQDLTSPVQMTVLMHQEKTDSQSSLTKTNHLAGEVIVPLKNVKKNLEFALYPNALRTRFWNLEQVNRETAESFSRSPHGVPAEFGFIEGLLKIQNVSICKEHDCQKLDAEKSNSKPFFSYQNEGNTLVIQQLPRVTQQAILKIQFVTTLPRTSGNFGVDNNNHFFLSAPAYPMIISELTNGNVTFEGFEGNCSTCEVKQKENATIQKFKVFPSPVVLKQLVFNTPNHTETPQPQHATELTHTRGPWTLLFSEESSAAVKAAVLKSVTLICEEFSLLCQLNSDEYAPQKIFIRTSALKDNLVSSYPHEIQLSDHFLAVLPFLQEFHLTALKRALLETMLFQNHSLRKNALPFALTNFKNEVNLLAEEATKTIAKRTDELEKLSENLSFFPLFDGIRKGRVLVNNEVLLGLREAPTALDRLPLDEISGALSGRQAIERAQWCLNQKSFESFKKSVFLYLKSGQPEAEEPFTSIYQQESPTCANEWPAVLKFPLVPELVEVTPAPCDGVTSEENCHTILASRKENMTYNIPFLLSQKKVSHDVFKIVSHAPDGKPLSTLEKWLHTQPRVTLIAAPQGDTTVTGPAGLQGSASWRRYPRPPDFLLTGFRFNYNSSQSEPDMQQGVQWVWPGDIYERAFSVLLKRISSASYADVFLRGNRLLEGNQKLPFGFGISAQFGTQHDLWAVGLFGWDHMNQNALAPEGWSVLWESRMSLVRYLNQGTQTRHPYLSQIFMQSAIPLGRLSTLTLNVRIGQSSETQALGGATGVAGHAPTALMSRSYSLFRSEISQVLLHHKMLNLGNLFGFEHLIFYGAHRGGVSEHQTLTRLFRLESLQSLELGFRFLGSFLSQKDQVITTSFVRSLGVGASRNSFSLSLGQEFF